MIIKIKKIFGKHDIEINLEKKCIILIGENGIGKSTSLKILDCLFNRKYLELIKYSFDNIEYDDKILNYNDLFPKIEEILPNYDFDNIDLSNNEFLIWLNFKLDNVLSIEGISYDNSKISKKFINEYDEIKNFFSKLDYKLYQEIIKQSLFYNEFSKKVKFEVEKMIYKESFSKILRFEKEELLKFIINNNSHEWTTLENSFFDYFNSTNNNQCLFLNMVDKYNINTYFSDFSLYENSLIKTEEEKEIKERFNYLYDKNEEINTNNEEFDLFGHLNIYKEYDVNELIYRSYESIDKINEYNFIEDINSNKKVDICNILYNNYYSKKSLKKFVNSYYNYIYYILNNKEKYKKDYFNTLINENYSNDEYIKYKCNIAPYIPCESFLFKTVEGITDINSKLFYKHIGNLIDELKSEKIMNLQLLFDKYFKNKKINVMANQLVISNNEKLNDDIDFIYLSEGEKKLILIFIIALLSDNLILLLDEPETSLSIVWQEDLLVDLLQYTNIKNIIVATQSPNIISKDELLNDIVGLPMENFNE